MRRRSVSRIFMSLHSTQAGYFGISALILMLEYQAATSAICSSLKLWAMIDICSCLRSPALNAFSWRSRYSTFSAAKCGASGCLAMPSTPWQTEHMPLATFLPAAGSAANAALAVKAAAMRAAAATGCFIDALRKKRAAARAAARTELLAVRNAIHRSGEIVGDQERAV